MGGRNGSTLRHTCALGASWRNCFPGRSPRYWKPREGKVGRKLDYIQWTIMADVVNSMRVTDALRELAGIDMEEVARNLDSFPGEVEGETA